MKKKVLITSIIAVFSLLSTQISARTINKIKVAGLNSISYSSIARFLKTGQDYTLEDENELLVGLYQTGYFSKVEIFANEKKSDELLVKVEENLVIGQVSYEGNKLLRDEMIDNYLKDKLNSGMHYNLSNIHYVVKELHEMYKALGCYGVTISPKMIKRDACVVDVVFEINESVNSRIDKILFVGNTVFSHILLSTAIETVEHKFWRFWNREGSILRDDLITKDIELMKSMYKEAGYLDIDINFTAELSADQKSYYVTFVINEGKRYKVSDIIIDCDIDKVDLKELQKFIHFIKDNWYNETEVIRSKYIMQRYICDKVYPSTAVNFELQSDHETHTTKIKYKITKVDKKFIDRINIRGNTKTVDRVIRREFELEEGDLLNTYLQQQTYANLRNTGYFESVDMKEQPGATPDTVNLDVEVKEGKTHTIQYGASASGQDGLGLFISYGERNFLGKGQIFTSSLDWKSKELSGSISLFEPKFFDSNIGAGLSLSASRKNRKESFGTDISNISLSPYISYEILEDLQHTIGYSLGFYKKKLHLSDTKQVTEETTPITQTEHPKRITLEELGNYTVGELYSTLTYTLYNDKYDKASACNLTWTTGYAGIGGNVRYWKNDFGVTYSRGLKDNLLFIAKASCGFLQEINNVKVEHRYTFGEDGNMFRGFAFSGIGPTDKHHPSDHLGGTRYYSGSLMLKTSIGAKEYGVNVIGFIDAGNVFGSKLPESRVDINSKLRVSVGFTLEWEKCPLGMPLKFVFATPIVKHKKDETKFFTLAGF